LEEKLASPTVLINLFPLALFATLSLDVLPGPFSPTKKHQLRRSQVHPNRPGHGDDDIKDQESRGHGGHLAERTKLVRNMAVSHPIKHNVSHSPREDNSKVR